MAQSLLLTFAVAIFVGSALKDFFQSFIANIVMPFLAVFLPGVKGVGDFVLELGPVKLKVGDALAAGGTLVVGTRDDDLILYLASLNGILHGHSKFSLGPFDCNVLSIDRDVHARGNLNR
jgi:hypothetical protein